MTETTQNSTPADEELIALHGLCPNCGIRPNQPGQRKCKQCHADYMRGWRLKATTIRLEDDNYEYLRRRAFNERTSMSKLINQAIEFQRVADGNVSRETKP